MRGEGGREGLLLWSFCNGVLETPQTLGLGLGFSQGLGLWGGEGECLFFAAEVWFFWFFDFLGFG